CEHAPTSLHYTGDMRWLPLLVLIGCGPSASQSGDGGGETCSPGATESCYEGTSGTDGVGPCHGGTRTCAASGTLSECAGQVVPVAESCTDHVDNNCNGMVDEDVDSDGDGQSTCGGDCCDSTECTNPKLVNQGAFDAPGNNVDDDCDGHVDNAQLACDQ